ncbi:MAG: hypothetical protein NVS3B24_06510 [Candidatus Dormibacteria bacterium]
MAAATVTNDRRPGRILGFSYASVALAVFVLVIPALRPPLPPPPPTAEFAPPVNQLKAPPPEQVSNAGQGPQGTSGGAQGGNQPGPQPSPSPSPTPSSPPSPNPTNTAQASTNGPVVDVPRIKHCVGDPPRQTEDTQSPPCISYFDGPNGGATYQGVTKDEIDVVFQDESYNFIEDMAAYFNDRYQFYGRKLKLINGGGFCQADPAKLKAKADGVVKSHRFFASTSCSDAGGLEGYYYDELASPPPALGVPVLSVSERANVSTNAHLAKYAPYEWNYFPAMDTIQAHYVQLACEQLKGKGASYTIPNLLFPPQRKFGVVNTKYTNAPSIDTSTLLNGLQGCGINVDPADHKEIDFSEAYPTDQQVVQEASAAAVDLNRDHVTTVLCICHFTTITAMMQGATAQNYQPEWLVSTFGYGDLEPAGRNQPEQQWSHALGVSFWNKYQPLPNMPCYWAERAANPSFNFQQSPFSEIGCQQDYNQLLVLAAGIQMAGPILTPQTFADGLRKTTFPNGFSPYGEGHVNFGSGHTFVDDAALLWYDPSTPSPYPYAAATWCYTRHGQRTMLDGYKSFMADFQSRPCDP